MFSSLFFWERVPDAIYLQRRLTGGQEAHDKRVRIANYHIHGSQNCKEAPPHTGQDGHRLQIINAREGVGRRGPFYTVGGNVNWCSH